MTDSSVRTYLINLDRRPDRFAAASDELARVGLEFTRVAGVDWQNVPELLETSKLLSPSQHACWLSHQRCFRQLISTGADWAFVLEDDAVLDREVRWPELITELASVLPTLGDDAIDVLQLGFISSQYARPGLRGHLYQFMERTLHPKLPITEITVAERELTVVRHEFRSGTHCYLVSRAGAAKLIDANLPPAFNADAFFLHLAETQRFRSSPYLTIARVAQSLAEQRSSDDTDLADHGREFAEMALLDSPPHG